MEQSGTYSESTLRNPETAKNGRSKVDLHIRISKENYIFLRENFNYRFSETINKLLDFLRTEQPFEILVFGKRMGSEGFEPSTFASSRRRWEEELTEQSGKELEEIIKEEKAKQSKKSSSLMDLELEYTKEELKAYTDQRLNGVSEKTKWWIERASEAFWEQTKGVISYNTINKFREFTLSNWNSRDAWSKVLSFGKSFLENLSKMRMDTRYQNFSIFLEMPKALKEKKRTTDRVITEKDVKNVIKFFVKRWKEGEGTAKLSREKALAHVTLTLLGAYTGQRPYTIKRLRVDQFKEALKSDPPVLEVKASQDKIRMEHYVPLHPDIIPFLKELVRIKEKKGEKEMFEYNSYEQILKREKIKLERGDLIRDEKKRHFVVGDLRKFAEQMADKIKWDVSNKNYILTHAVSSIDWKNYKHPLPENVYEIYMESWKNVHLVPKEAYELLKAKK